MLPHRREDSSDEAHEDDEELEDETSEVEESSATSSHILPVNSQNRDDTNATIIVSSDDTAPVIPTVVRQSPPCGTDVNAAVRTTGDDSLAPPSVALHGQREIVRGSPTGSRIVLPSIQTLMRFLEPTPPSSSLHASPVAEQPSDPTLFQHSAVASAPGPAPTGAHSSGSDNIRADSQMSQKRNMDEVRFLEEDDSRMEQRENQLLQLIELGEKRNKVRIRLWELAQTPVRNVL
jgi:hypothetical protein